VDVGAGQAIVTSPGEWVRYSTPTPDGAEYVAICLPAFSMDSVHRDDDAPEGKRQNSERKTQNPTLKT